MAAKTRAAKAGEETTTAGRVGRATGIVTFLVGILVVAYLSYTNPDPKSFEDYNYLNTALCLWVPLMVILLILRQEPGQFGMTRGDRKLGLKWALIFWIGMVAPLAVISHLPEFKHYYLDGRLRQWIAGVGQVYDGAHVNLKALLYYELGMGFYMFCWEYFFRGFLLFGLQKTRLGTWGAIVVQALLFMFLHWSWKAGASKPSIEVLSALPGGLILGYFAVRTRSFFYGYLTHWAVSATLDVFLLAPFIFAHIG